jgi:hypothetical protein
MQRSLDTKQMIQNKIKNTVEANTDILGSIAAKMQFCQDTQQYFQDKKQTLGFNIASLAALQCADINKNDYHGVDLATHLEKSFIELIKNQSFDQAVESIQQFQDTLYEIHKEVTVLALKSIFATTETLTLNSIASDDAVIQLVIKTPANLSNYDQNELDRIFNVFINRSKILERIQVQTPDSQSPLQKRRATIRRQQPEEKQPEVSTIESVFNWFTGTTPATPIKQEVKQERVAVINTKVTDEFRKSIQPNQGTTSEPVKVAHQRSNTISSPSQVEQTKVQPPVKQELVKSERSASVRELQKNLGNLNNSQTVSPTSTSGLVKVSSQTSMVKAEPKQDETPADTKINVKDLTQRLGSINLGKQPQNMLTQNRSSFHQSSEVEKKTPVNPSRTGKIDQSELQQKLNNKFNKPGL